MTSPAGNAFAVRTGPAALLTVVFAVAGCSDGPSLSPDTSVDAALTSPETQVAAASAPGIHSAGSELQVADVFGQAEVGDRETVYAEGGATLRRTPNGITIRVEMPTPEPGTYAYPERAEPGHPEAFTLWIFADVRITIAPHGRVDPERLPDQIQTPSGSDPFWWAAEFD